MTQPQAILSVPSPFGLLGIAAAGGEITGLHWGAESRGTPTDLLREAEAQIADYLAGRRTAFDLPLRFGEGFRGDFLRALVAIPYGRTRTYGDLARDLGVTAQAIGQACGRNRIPILIPCHRVLAAGGLGGYSAPGGVETKVALLRHEGAAGLLL